MKANTLSLLNSPWMITDSGANSLLPFLSNILSGSLAEEKETVFSVVYADCGEDGEEYDITESVPEDSKYICVLNIKTPIYKYDQFCGPMGTRSMKSILEEWEANDNIVGVILDIDSPGGQVSGLAEFANFLFNYSKPLVAYSDGAVCSAAYYIAAATKYRVLNPYADYVGSIGTMLKYVDLDGILTEQGAVIKDIYASKSTRKNEEGRALKDGDTSLVIQNLLDPLRDQFVADVSKFVPTIKPEVFEGAVYMPEEALAVNLVDSLGTMKDAMDKIIELSKAKPKKSSTNQSMNTMSTTKKLPRVEAVLGLEAPLAISENGTFLNEEQLDTVEGHIDTLQNSNETLTSQLAEANTARENAVAAVQGQLTEATNSITTVEASVDGALENAGLPVEGTLTEKLAALNTYTAEKGALDGTSHTTVKTDANADNYLSSTSELDEALKNS